MKNDKFDITNLKKCIISLKESIEAYDINNNEKIRSFIEDSCVKRFEYTIETSWKIMKKYLKEFYGKNDKELTINNIFRLMEGYNFIKCWEVWCEYYENRNEYNNKKSNEILKIMKNFLQDVEYFYNELEKELNKKNIKYDFLNY